MRDSEVLDKIVDSTSEQIKSVGLTLDQITTLLTASLAMRQADNIDEAIYISERVLKINDYDAKINLIDEQGIQETIDKIGIETILKENYTPDGTQHHFQIRGKKSIQQVIEYPENHNRVLGLLTIYKEDVTAQEKEFLTLYSTITGLAIHHGMQTDHYKKQEKFSNDVLDFLRHELRNRISLPSYLTQYINMTLDQMNMSEETREDLGDMVTRTEKATDEALEILSLCTIANITPKKIKEMYLIGIEDLINLKEHINDKAREYSKIMPDKTIVTSIDENLKDREYMMMESYINTLLNNLLGNAKEYSAPNALIYLSLSTEENDLVFKCTSTSESPLSENEIRQNENKYTRSTISNTKDRHGLGEGIGSYLMRSLVERAYHGTMKVTSEKEFDIKREVSDQTKETNSYGRFNTFETIPFTYTTTFRFPLENIMMPK